VIAAANPILASAWPSGWEDVEVVDSQIVEEPGAARGGAGCRPGLLGLEAVAAACYDGSGRVAAAGRFGRLVSVLA
jgi:hypothetical protein